MPTRPSRRRSNRCSTPTPVPSSPRLPPMVSAPAVPDVHAGTTTPGRTRPACYPRSAAWASGGMADAHGSGPCVRKDVGVQLPPRPPAPGDPCPQSARTGVASYCRGADPAEPPRSPHGAVGGGSVGGRFAGARFAGRFALVRPAGPPRARFAGRFALVRPAGSPRVRFAGRFALVRPAGSPRVRFAGRFALVRPGRGSPWSLGREREPDYSIVKLALSELLALSVSPMRSTSSTDASSSCSPGVAVQAAPPTPPSAV